MQGYNNHPLHSTWTLCYSLHSPTKQQPETLVPEVVAQVSTLEDFLSFYHHLKKPSNLQIHTRLSLLRHQYSPTIFKPNAGNLLLQFKNVGDKLVECDRVWEKLLFCCVGEVLGEHTLGVQVEINSKGGIITTLRQPGCGDISDQFNELICNLTQESVKPRETKKPKHKKHNKK